MRTSLAAKFLLALVRGYRRWISPFMGAHCRFYPSCSAYAQEALQTYGALRGSVLASKRILRCHPFNPGGVDHVPVRDDRRGGEAA